MIKNPIVLDFPSQFETERLLIRAPQSGDGKQLHDVVHAAQEHLRPWLPWSVNLPDEEGYEVFVRESHIRFVQRKDLQLLIFLKNNKILIGSTGLHTRDWTVPRLEIGYWLAPNYTGQGYMTEAVKGVEKFAIEELGAKRLEIQALSDNTPSIAVAKRCGYTLESTIHHHSRHHLTNELQTMVVFSKLFNNV